MSVRQVHPYDHWPSGDGRPIAMLTVEPPELATRYGLEFEEDYDDLDYYTLAAIELPDGSQDWLMRHRGNPVPGTTVSVDAKTDPVKARKLLTKALGLKKTDFRWVSPRDETQRSLN